MIAEVYPALTLPRHLGYFDYRIPKNLDVQIGDLVSIPFSGRYALGIVKRVKPDSELETKSAEYIENLKYHHYYSESEIQRFEAISQEFFCSVSSLLRHTSIEPKSGSPPSQIKQAPHAQKSSVDFIRSLDLTTPPESISCSLDTEVTLAFALLSKQYKLIILVPSRNRGYLFSKRLGNRAAFLHAKRTSDEQSQIISAWFKGDIHALIVTPTFASVPLADATHFIMTDGASELYEVQKRHPHIDARHIFRARAKQASVTLIQTSRILSLTSQTSNLKPPTFSIQPTTIPTFISPRGEKHTIRGMANSFLDLIQEASDNKQPVTIIHNKKGHAAGLICRSCGKTPKCACGANPSLRKDDLICQSCGTEMWVPTSCPYCLEPDLTERGIGIATLEKKLRAKFPEAKLQIGTITELGNLPKNGMLIVTNFDQNLARLDYRNQILTADRLWNYLYSAHDHGSDVYIQTMQNDLLTKMLDQEQFVQSEREMRNNYHLPPFSRLIRIIDKYGDIDYDKLLIAAKKANISVIQIDQEQIELRGDSEAFQHIQPELAKLPIRSRLLSAFTL